MYAKKNPVTHDMDLRCIYVLLLKADIHFFSMNW